MKLTRATVRAILTILCIVLYSLWTYFNVMNWGICDLIFTRSEIIPLYVIMFHIGIFIWVVIFVLFLTYMCFQGWVRFNDWYRSLSE